MEAELNKSLDTLIGQLERSMHQIVATAKLRPDAEDDASDKKGNDVNADVKDRHRVAQEHQKSSGAVANIMHTAETLLSVTAGLKQQLLLNDFATLNATLSSRVALVHRTIRDNDAALDDALDAL
ncbi:hypothetical protein BC830DRAFT_886404 [Chytriomyces sp. MP71]|nr:hypothetical protein BC830DRAFT_886404 [Chytriomyces sp. MP71]